jgi:hypothetical protein
MLALMKIKPYICIIPFMFILLIVVLPPLFTVCAENDSYFTVVSILNYNFFRI